MQLSFDFSDPPAPAPARDQDARAELPVTNKQQRYAQQIAERLRVSVPKDALHSRAALSVWIDRHKQVQPAKPSFSGYPSSKQVAFAEKLARIKRRAVPDACFRDRVLMSRWIDRLNAL